MAEQVKTTPFAIEKFLKGIDFPCSKQDLIDHAENNNAPQDVISTLNSLPDQDFSSVNDVMKAYGKVRP